MIYKRSKSEKAFSYFNALMLTFLGLICLLPFVNIVALSFSENAAVMAGIVRLWPVKFTMEPYLYVLARAAFWHAFLVTLERVALGVTMSVVLTIMAAYPLSKPAEKFQWRTLYAWVFFFTMLFSGGLIPSYLLVYNLQLRDTIWALVLPGAVNVFNIILLLNFFRQIPMDLEDSAFVDGATHFRIMWQIYVPTSMPAIATIILFSIVGHWNSWLDGLIYMNTSENYPLQTYLQTIIVRFNFQTLSPRELARLMRMNVRSVKSAQIVVAALPILMAYPFLQKYFVKGIILGSVKG